MKQINVPVGDDVYAAAKMGAAAAGIPMKDWVARAVLHYAAPDTQTIVQAARDRSSARAVETEAPESPQPQTCTRTPLHDGPCNGWPRTNCHADAPGELTIDPNQDFGA